MPEQKHTHLDAILFCSNAFCPAPSEGPIEMVEGELTGRLWAEVDRTKGRWLGQPSCSVKRSVRVGGVG